MAARAALVYGDERLVKNAREANAGFLPCGDVSCLSCSKTSPTDIPLLRARYCRHRDSLLSVESDLSLGHLRATRRRGEKSRY
jgi:hypothetical protein